MGRRAAAVLQNARQLHVALDHPEDRRKKSQGADRRQPIVPPDREYQRVGALKAIKEDLGISILVLAHTPKRTIARPLTENDLAGSKNLANFADNLFAIGRSPHGPDIRYIKPIKIRNSAPLLPEEGWPQSGRGGGSYDASNVNVCRLEKILISSPPYEGGVPGGRGGSLASSTNGTEHTEDPRPEGNFPCFTFLNFAPECAHTTRPYDNTNADREHLKAEVRRLAAEGYTQRQIAIKLGISLGAVNKYLAGDH